MNNPKPAAKADDKSGKSGKEPAGFFQLLGQLFGEDPAPGAKAQQDYMKVYERRAEFMKEETTGFVWLYLQK